MACCFSNFKQLFATGQEFTYSIEDIARYYRTYLELMEHWERVLPGASCACSTRTSSRISRATCGGSWILRPGVRAAVPRVPPDRAQRAHREPEQVRRPIYREGLDQWRTSSPGSVP